MKNPDYGYGAIRISIFSALGYIIVGGFYDIVLSPLVCISFRYKGYHDNFYPYKRSSEYWNILAARLAFVFVFQLTVYFITTFIAWIIPDIPEELEYKKKREKELEKAIIHDHVNSNF